MNVSPNHFDLLASAISARWPRETSRTSPVPERDHEEALAQWTADLAPTPVDATDLYGRLITALAERWPQIRQITKVADVGRIVADRRRELGLSQNQVAFMASVGRRFVSEFENGKASSQMGEALRVIGALGLKVTVAPAAIGGPS